MHSTKMTLVIVGALLAATMLTGCQSKELAACKDNNAFLERRIGEYKQVVDMRDKELKDREDEIKRLVDTVAKNDEKISLLEKENQELHNKLSMTPEEAKKVIQGVAELKRLQQEAAEKLKKQQVTDTNQPK